MKITVFLVTNLLRFLLYFEAHGQKGHTINLIQSELKFPYQSDKSGLVLSTSIYIEDTLKSAYVLPMISGEKHVYKFGMGWLLPYTREVQEAIMHQPFIREHNFCLITTSSRDSIWISIDENANKDFSDEVINAIKIGQPIYKKLNLVLDSLTHQKFLVPVQIVVNHLPSNQFKISCHNLIKHELLHHLEDTTLRLTLLMTPLDVKFKIQDTDLKDGKTRLQSIGINEPFFFNGKLRILEQFDLLKTTVRFRTLNADEIPFGHREGYFINMKKLRKLTEPYLTPDCSLSWSKPGYFLLYFWGHWCAPCMNKLEETKSFAASLKSSDQIAFIHYPAIFNKKDTTALAKVIASNNLPCRQIVQIIGPEEVKEESSIHNVASLAKITAYPSYLLLNAEGKILYRGENKGQELNALIKELKLLSDE